MSKPTLRRGLYAITDSGYIQPHMLGNAVQRAIIGGAVMIQYRDKGRNPGRRKREAAQIRNICHDRDILLIINDDMRLAEDIHADGVHLGRGDWAIETARKSLGDDVIIGASCYNSLGLARRARDNGADYVTFGSFFPSQTNARAERAHSDLLTEAREELGLHIVATGGILPGNGAGLVRAGADMIAACGGVFNQRDAESAAHHYAALFSNADSADN